MNKIIQFSIFISVFLIIFLSLHYYVFYRFSGFFEIKRNAYFYVVMIFLALSYPIASIIERSINNFFSRFFYTFSAIWIGVVFLLFSSLLVYEVVRLFLKIPAFKAGIVILSLVIIITIYSLINAWTPVVKTIDIHIEGIKDLKAVQLTDIHVGTIRTSKYLKDIVDKTNSLNPDVVFITGDLVDGSGPLEQGMFDALNNLKAKTFFIIGNHEGYEGLDKVSNVLKNLNMKTLRNEVVDFNGVSIVGVDYSDSKSYLGEVLPTLNISKSKPSILLYHSPISLDAAVKEGIDLQLSGHTHDGQLFPFSLLVKTAYKYSVGLHDYKGVQIYISPGTGTWGPPMRLGSNSEITLINFV